MKYLVLFAYLICSYAVLAQPSPEIIQTNEGDIKIYPILHATMVIQFQNQTIYIDPYGGVSGFDGIEKPDLIVITDIHGDHMNIKTLEEMNAQGIQIIAPKAVKEKLGEAYSKVSVLSNNESTTIDQIEIKAIAMYNLPESADSRHPKGRGNGYVFKMGGKNIYISGDTEDIPEMRALQNIDVAFVCMNLPYTMTVDAAASAVLEFQPKVVYPFHYRGKEGLADVSKFKDLVSQSNDDMEVRLINWYPENNKD